MPRILNGYWCAGVGGGIASVGRLPNLTPLAQWSNAGGSCFLNDRGDVIFQHGAHLERFNVINGEYQDDFDAQGCFALAAGGDVYAASFFDGVRVSTEGPKRYPAYGIADVGPNGAVYLLQPDGTLDGRVPVSGSVQAVDGGYVALDAQFRPYGGGIAYVPVALPGRIYGLRVHGDLCCYHAEEGGRIIVQRRDFLIGVELARGVVNCYRPDFEERDGVITLVYAAREGEAPGELVILQTDRSQFVPLSPDVSTPAPVPTPVPQPPIPEPVPMVTPVNRLADVQRIRAKYPTPLGDKHGTFLIELALALDGLLYRKPNGDHTTLPDGTPVSLDIVILPMPDGPWWVDVLADAEGDAIPTWDAHPNAEHPENFVAVAAPTPAPNPQPNPNPTPTPSPVPPSADLAALVAAVADLADRVGKLERWTRGV